MPRRFTTRYSRRPRVTASHDIKEQMLAYDEEQRERTRLEREEWDRILGPSSWIDDVIDLVVEELVL